MFPTSAPLLITFVESVKCYLFKVFLRLSKTSNGQLPFPHSYSKDLLPFRGCKCKHSFISSSYYVGHSGIIWHYKHAYPVEEVASALDSPGALELSLHGHKSHRI